MQAQFTPKIISNERGYVLVAALVFLVLLTLIGAIIISKSTFEREAGSNERHYTESFYKAESGLSAAIALLASNIDAKGFSASERTELGDIGFDAETISGDITFYEEQNSLLQTFFEDSTHDAECTNYDGTGTDYDQTDIYAGGSCFAAYHDNSGDHYRDAYFPRVDDSTGSATDPDSSIITSLKIDFIGTENTAGSGIKTNSGYHGSSSKGQHGTNNQYFIRAHNNHIDLANTQLVVKYRHFN